MKQNKTIFTTLLMLLFGAVTMFGQVAISGTVTESATGEPVIGASVVEEGTSNGTITDFDGNFALTVQEGAQVTVSYVGFKAQTFLRRPSCTCRWQKTASCLRKLS